MLVLCYLSSKHLVNDIYECRMLSMLCFALIACSPQAVAFIDEILIGMGSSFELQLASVEIKTSFGSSIVWTGHCNITSTRSSLVMLGTKLLEESYR